MELKNNIGERMIENRSKEINELFLEKIKGNANIKILGMTFQNLT